MADPAPGVAHPLSRVPPFLVGLALAVTGVVAGAVLLYSGAGFFRALSVLLATQTVALAAGLWSVERIPDPEVEDALRRRWILALAAFTAAALLTALWQLRAGGASRGFQGAGLALLAALPPYAAGSVLGLLTRTASGGGAAALLGAATGFLAGGFLLLPRFAPTTALLLPLAALAGAGVLHGALGGAGSPPPREASPGSGSEGEGRTRDPGSEPAFPRAPAPGAGEGP